MKKTAPFSPSPEARAVLRDINLSVDKMARELADEYFTYPTEHDILVARAIFMRGLLFGIDFTRKEM